MFWNLIFPIYFFFNPGKDFFTFFTHWHNGISPLGIGIYVRVHIPIIVLSVKGGFPLLAKKIMLDNPDIVLYVDGSLRNMI